MSHGYRHRDDEKVFHVVLRGAHSRNGKAMVDGCMAFPRVEKMCSLRCWMVHVTRLQGHPVGFTKTNCLRVAMPTGLLGNLSSRGMSRPRIGHGFDEAGYGRDRIQEPRARHPVVKNDWPSLLGEGQCLGSEVSIIKQIE